MTKQCGKDIVVSIENNEATPAFEAVLGLRSRSIAINSETIDVTAANSTGQWRELLACGIRSLSISGSGVADTGSALSELVEVKMAGSLRTYQFLVPGLGTFECDCKITQMEFAGEFNGEVTNSFTFESAGEVTFTAV